MSDAPGILLSASPSESAVTSTRRAMNACSRAEGSHLDARLVQDRTMIIGRVTGQFGQHRILVNSEYQHRCEGTPLRVDTSGCHNRSDSWIGLGNNLGAIQMSPEATSTAGRGYFDVPFYVNQGTWTMATSNRLLLEGGFTAFRYQPPRSTPAR